MTNAKRKKDSIIGRLFDPTHIYGRYSSKGLIPPSKLELGQDAIIKMAGGLILGLAVGDAMGWYTSAKKRGLPKKDRKQIENYLRTKYVSIPTESEPSVHEELLKKHKEGSDGEGSGSTIGSFFLGSAPAWYLPVAVGAMLAGGTLGYNRSLKAHNKRNVASEKKKQEDINRQIGRLVEEEYRRTRGQDKTSNDDASMTDRIISGVTSLTGGYGKLLSLLFVTGVLSGGAVGWKKGRSENPNVILHKQLNKALKRHQEVQDSPRIIVPRSLSGYKDTAAKRPPSQQGVELPEIGI